EPRDQALEIPAVVEALVGGIEAGCEAVAPEAAAIVRGLSVLETVGQEEIDDLVLRRAIAEATAAGGSAIHARRARSRCSGQVRCEQQQEQRLEQPTRPHLLVRATAIAHRARAAAVPEIGFGHFAPRSAHPVHGAPGHASAYRAAATDRKARHTYSSFGSIMRPHPIFSGGSAGT